MQAARKLCSINGKVFAKTVTEFEVEIPYEYEKKVYTGEDFEKKTLNFFNFSFTFIASFVVFIILYYTKNRLFLQVLARIEQEWDKRYKTTNVHFENTPCFLSVRLHSHENKKALHTVNSL